MPYSPYFPVTYNPYAYYPQQAQQPVQPQTQQTGIIWVNSGVEAQAYPVAPNTAVTLWSASEPVVYLKKTDASGKPTLTTYDLVERDISKKEYAAEPAYATKDDLTTVAEVVAGLKTDIETMKGDMYGIAGKKSKPKKVEEDE